MTRRPHVWQPVDELLDGLKVPSTKPKRGMSPKQVERAWEKSVGASHFHAALSSGPIHSAERGHMTATIHPYKRQRAWLWVVWKRHKEPSVGSDVLIGGKLVGSETEAAHVATTNLFAQWNDACRKQTMETMAQKLRSNLTEFNPRAVFARVAKSRHAKPVNRSLLAVSPPVPSALYVEAAKTMRAALNRMGPKPAKRPRQPSQERAWALAREKWGNLMPDTYDGYLALMDALKCECGSAS